jgi:hypothetical protein
MHYVEASWYASEIGSDVECGRCHRTLNTKKNLTDRALLRFQLDGQGTMVSVELSRPRDRVAEARKTPSPH